MEKRKIAEILLDYIKKHEIWQFDLQRGQLFTNNIENKVKNKRGALFFQLFIKLWTKTHKLRMK